ncbi:hypothetical protein [Maricaulis sp.]|jgi:hypothetical protein|uniref:hypothetical protein n=1 Tax=Maricaulis sp. TaxID=1486257 RepID=UPI002602C6FF|nr:hypothetical protein [Maricaulis sp.]
MHDDLTGVWFGEYAYPVDQPPVSFIANIDERDGSISGRVDEPNTNGMPFTDRLFAHLSGTRQDDYVLLTKTYDGTGGVTHSVTYTGQVNATGDLIEGIWRTGGWSGRFAMSRPQVGNEEKAVSEREKAGA